MNKHIYIYNIKKILSKNLLFYQSFVVSHRIIIIFGNVRLTTCSQKKKNLPKKYFLTYFYTGKKAAKLNKCIYLPNNFMQEDA